jgi:hypothetical protein
MSFVVRPNVVSFVVRPLGGSLFACKKLRVESNFRLKAELRTLASRKIARRLPDDARRRELR